MTERLYYLDPYLKEFTAKVVRTTDRGVVLDRTAFYPTGGGQPCDLGTLNGIDVTDVVEDGRDVVHAVASPVDGEVRGVIDWDRRRDHMQQHHGQHLLSEAFIRVAKAQTSSFHLGKQGCSIDLDKDIAPVDLERAETLANMVIYENRPVQISFFGHEEAKSLPMRKPPPDEERIRVVTVNDFDCQACCGTHPRTTGEVGVVCVTGSEKTKGSTRVYFVCGYRALTEARENAKKIKAVSLKLSAGRDDLEAALEKVQSDAADTWKQLAAAEKKLAEYVGRDLAARGKVVVEVFEGKGLEYLRALATAVVAQPGKVAILGGTGATSSVVVARSADLSIDLRPLFKDVLAPIQGKGGGSAHFVQGGGPGADVRAALKAAEEKIVANLGA